MPNYREESVAGKQWLRCAQVIIDNPFGGTPKALMREERIVAVEGETPTRVEVADFLSVPYTPQAEFPLINPLTDEPTGKTLTQAEAYAMVYSLYRATAKARDEA